MSKNYLTVKEFAEERSCSTQYVYKLLQTKLQPYVVMVEGKKCIDIKALEVFSETDATNHATNFATNFATEFATPSASNIDEELKRINARNEDLIDDLRAQIKEKDAQIQQMNEKLINLFETNQRLMENNQKLQLNYQMLLGDGKNIEVDAEVNEQESRAGVELEEEIEVKKEPEQAKKRGFFSRLFNI